MPGLYTGISDIIERERVDITCSSAYISKNTFEFLGFLRFPKLAGVIITLMTFLEG
jgi:hypothetical protein